MYKVNGNTFYVKDFLKQVGFKWDSEKKVWIGDEEANKELEIGRSNTFYGRKVQNILYKFNITSEKI